MAHLSRLALLLLLVWPATAAARPAGQATAATRPTRAGPREYRFDALRFAGQLSGPHALIARGQRRAKRASLLKLRRSFVRRIFETVEAPTLHR